jgi:hypothetical protein
MSTDPLATYLHDHLAGATATVELLAMLVKEHGEGTIGEVAATLLGEVREDRATLRSLAEEDGQRAGLLKAAAAWVGSKIGRVRLGRAAAGKVGTWETLEALALAILGKLALWEALREAVPSRPELADVDLATLIARAHWQHATAEGISAWRPPGPR